MAKSSAGSGKETSFGKIEGAQTVPVDNEGYREGFTKQDYCTSIPQPWYQKKANGLAGGDTGRWQNPQEDCLPGEKGK